MSASDDTTPHATVRRGSAPAWAAAVRPRSLLVALSPVLVGAALGFARSGHIDARAALLVLGAALLVQIVTNLQNDVGYTLRGAERSGTRRGLPRATAEAWLGVRQVRAAIVAAALAAAALALVLAFVALVAALLALVAALLALVAALLALVAAALALEAAAVARPTV